MATNLETRAYLRERNDTYHVLIVWYDETGKRKQTSITTGLSISGHNKRKAEARMKELLEEFERTHATRSTEELFSDYLLKWVELTKHEIAESTYSSHKRTIKNSICPWFKERKIKLKDLTAEDIQKFYNHKLDDDKVSPNTVKHYHAHIHKALKDAVKQRKIKENPADFVTLPKVEKHIADFYTEDELRTLLARAKGTKLETVVNLAAWFGLRRGEIIGLKWDAVDLDNKVLYVLGVMRDKGNKTQKMRDMYFVPAAKTKSSIRSFPMSDCQVAYLKKLKARQELKSKNSRYDHTWDGFVCVRDDGRIIPLEYVTRAFPQLCTKCGLRRLRLHELRHSNISLLLEQGASIKEAQDWAGHKNFTLTADIYGHLTTKSKLRMAQMVDDALGNK
jgi:integrase